MNHYLFSGILLLLTSTVVAGLVGCGEAPTKKSASSQSTVTAGPPATVETAHDHVHPTEGLHGGGLIELGNEEYHAELVHDDAAATVTIYLLDSPAKQAVGIDAKDIAVNLSHEGQAEQFRIAASPDSTDQGGKSSRFVSTDPELTKELDHEHVTGQLVVVINGKQFRGDVQHEHEGHDHEVHEHGSDETP